MIQLSELKPEPGPFAARLENKHEIEKHVALMARNRHPATRNRLPLDPRKQTFRLDSLTSVVDPKETWVTFEVDGPFGPRLTRDSSEKCQPR